MQKSFSDFEYAVKKKSSRRDRFLARIDEMTPWSQPYQQIESFYPKAKGAGRPPVGPARMLRVFVTQQCFGLSEFGMDDAIYYINGLLNKVRQFIELQRQFVADAAHKLRSPLTVLKLQLEGLGRTQSEHALFRDCAEGGLLVKVLFRLDGK